MENNAENKLFVKSCCTTQPVQSDYTPIGENITLSDSLECYVVGDKNAKASIIYVYDIFAKHPQAYQGCDILANSGFRVIMPDFFRGEASTEEMLKDMSSLISWILKVGSYSMLEKDFNTAKDYLTKEGFDTIFAVGFCYGGKLVMNLAGQNPFIKAGAIIHPSVVEPSELDNCKVPIIMLPAHDDPDMLPVYEALKKKPFGDQCYHQRFDDMKHGWCSSRGDWANPTVAARANEAFTIVVNRFRDMV
ncbi:hypothetical protein BB560_000850 [Smittium megazygosporum]|uniref:Dienelactone hydrolase domain-containing protein n=1 Tax=Smittium megazygosporum TaxID=133381 RepID=A0A2T9ZJA8_9FUNG|nr:hypothetical protein BB560_000850 [Smittium megazygosporum]